MPDPRQVQRASTYFLSSAMVVIGLVMIVVTLTRGGGALAGGLVLGVLFTLAGAGRLFLERRRSE